MSTICKKAGLICATVASVTTFCALPISVEPSVISGIVLTVDQAAPRWSSGYCDQRGWSPSAYNTARCTTLHGSGRLPLLLGRLGRLALALKSGMWVTTGQTAASERCALEPQIEFCSRTTNSITQKDIPQ
jgi:hypothetical protein